MTSIPEKLAEQRRVDQRPPTARQSRQREIEHRSQDSSGKGSRGAKRVSTWLECSGSLGPSLAPEVEATARRISAPYENGETLEWARRIAEAQVDLTRVRNSRRQLITRLLVDPGFRPAQVYRQQLRVAKMVLGGKRSRMLPINVDEVGDTLSSKPPEGEEKLAIILEQKISEFAAFDRYERRALSRRKVAIRNFDAARCCGVQRGA